MATLSAASNWVCGTCASPNKGGKFCTMCANPRPKRQAVLAALAADMPVAAAAAPAKVHPPLGAVATANVPPPVPAYAPMVVGASSAPAVQAMADSSFHPTGIVVEIVGTERSDQGHSCEEHIANCGEVMANDVVVRLQKVQIMVEGWEETAIAAVWINDGIYRCRVGFLPCHMVAHAARYDGAVAQVTRVFCNDPTFCNSAECRMFHRYDGCCLVAIIVWPSHPRDTANH
jgi:hypothetical protein